jgi:hypothetical protein
MFRLQQMAYERYPLRGAGNFAATGARAAKVDNRPRLAANLVTGKVSYIGSPQSLTKRIQSIDKAINFIA